MSNDIKPCPFCGGEPYFEGDVTEWKEDACYVELSIKCCATITDSIGWRKARNMSFHEREQYLKEKLVDSWNLRV